MIRDTFGSFSVIFDILLQSSDHFLKAVKNFLIGMVYIINEIVHKEDVIFCGHKPGLLGLVYHIRKLIIYGNIKGCTLNCGIQLT